MYTYIYLYLLIYMHIYVHATALFLSHAALLVSATRGLRVKDLHRPPHMRPFFDTFPRLADRWRSRFDSG